MHESKIPMRCRAVGCKSKTEIANTSLTRLEQENLRFPTQGFASVLVEWLHYVSLEVHFNAIHSIDRSTSAMRHHTEEEGIIIFVFSHPSYNLNTLLHLLYVIG